MTEVCPKNQGEFHRGWRIILVSLLGIGLGLTPIPFYSIGVFAPELVKAFGWSTSQVMLGLSIATGMTLLAGPAAAIAVTRFGHRRVIICSQVMFGVSLMSLAFLNGSLVQYYLFWATLAILGAGTLPITWTHLVSIWFDARRGLALGIALMGAGLFGFISKPYLAWLIEDFGWRSAFIGLGLLPILIGAPISFFFLSKPDSGAPKAARINVVRQKSTMVLRDWRLWWLAGALLIVSIALSGAFTNLETMLIRRSVSAEVILAVTPLLGLSSLIARLGGGWLLDRKPANLVAFVMLSLPALSFWIFAFGPTGYVTLAIAVILLGLALGTESDLMAYIASRYFDFSAYAIVFGWFFAALTLGLTIGPVLFSFVADVTGGYQQVLILSSGFLVLGAAMFLLIGRAPTT